MKVDQDGQLLLGHNRKLYRYLPSGFIDATFGNNGSINTSQQYEMTDLGIQGDGKILIAGRYVYRVNQDGSNLERLVGSSGLQGIQVWDDGDFLVLNSGFDISRYNRDGGSEGSYSNSFGHSESMLFLPDNKMLMIGHSSSGDSGDMVVSRHLAGGQLDTTFGSNGKVQLPVLEGNDAAYRASLQADGKILIVGDTDTGANRDIAVARISYDGVPDTSFFTGYNDATVSFRISDDGDDYGRAVLHMPDGRIVVAGYTGSDITLARLLGDTNQNNAPVNQPPVNTVPTEVQVTMVNTPIAFTAYRENQISISDPDAGNLEVDVTLTAENGLVTLVNRTKVSSGLTYLVGDGLEDATMTVRGKMTEINTALSWVAFTPTANYTGDAGKVTITTNDQGNVGSGGAKSDTDTISITVNPLEHQFADSPTWKTVPGALDTSFDEDGRQILSLSAGTDRIYNMQLLPDGKIIAAGAVDGKLALMRFCLLYTSPSPRD